MKDGAPVLQDETADLDSEKGVREAALDQDVKDLGLVLGGMIIIENAVAPAVSLNLNESDPDNAVLLE